MGCSLTVFEKTKKCFNFTNFIACIFILVKCKRGTARGQHEAKKDTKPLLTSDLTQNINFKNYFYLQIKFLFYD